MTPDEAYVRATSDLNKNPSKISSQDWVLWKCYGAMAEELGTLYTKEILALQLATAENTAAGTQFRVLSVGGLRLQRSDSVEDRVEALLLDESVREVAASVLAVWGTWDQCMQVLMDAEWYSVLYRNGCPDLDSQLQAALPLASPHGRLNAAFLLEDMGRSGILKLTSAQTLDSVLVDGWTWPDEQNLYRSVAISLEVLKQEEGFVADYLVPASSSGSREIRLLGFYHTARLAMMNDINAVALLETLSESATDSDVREHAAFYLHHRIHPTEPNFPAAR